LTAKLAADVRKGFKELLQYPHMSRDGYLALHTLFSFRTRSIGDALQGFVEEAEEYGVELWAAIFPPSISWMVGQNYSILKEYLKDIQVMLYHRGDGAACLNAELGSLLRLLGDGAEARRALKSLTGIDVGLQNLESGIEFETIVEEAWRCWDVLSEDSVPIIWGLEQYEENERRIMDIFGRCVVFKPCDVYQEINTK